MSCIGQKGQAGIVWLMEHVPQGWSPITNPLTGGHAPPIGGSMETTTTAGDLNYLREKKVRSSWSYEASRNITRLSASES